MKVLHLIQELAVGGAERVVAAYALNHDRSRFAPQVCALTTGGAVADELAAAGVRVTVLGKRKGLDPRVLFGLRRLIRADGITVLHLHNPAPNNWGVPAALLCPGVVTVRTEHNVFYRGG